MMYSNYCGENGGFQSNRNLSVRSRSTMDVNKAVNFDNSTKNYAIIERNNNKDNAQSCLMEDLRCHLKQRDVEVTCSENEKPSRRSDSFVKKLVASLERRQRENEELQRRPPPLLTKLNRDHLCTISASKVQLLSQQQTDGKHFEENDFQQYQTLPRQTNNKQLEVNYKDTEQEESNNNSFDSQDSNSQYFWEQEDEILPLPSYCSINDENEWRIPSVTNSNSNKSSVRRTFKNMLSSIMNWRSVKSLPKGSRDYYAARESLGEEMRAFRRDTMPRLMERAVVKSCLLPNRSEAPAKRTARTCELSELLARATPRMGEISPKPCIATIHPIYGNKTIGLQQQTHVEKKAEIVCRSRRIQVPPPPSNLGVDSKNCFLQKRLSREVAQELVRKIESKQHTTPYSEPADYDIPRKLVLTDKSTQESCIFRANSHNTIPQYENFSSIATDDKRLHCTIFTTF